MDHRTDSTLDFPPTRSCCVSTRMDGRIRLARLRGVFSKARNQRRIWPCQIGSQTREASRPPPLAIVTMLGLTQKLGQANAERARYDFSIEPLNSFAFAGVVAIPSEILFCEQHPLDARDRVADRCPLFPFRGQAGRPPAARGGDCDRTCAGSDQRSAEPVEQPLL